MDAKEAIAAAKRYVNEIYADEQVTNLGLEEIEHVLAAGNWVITLGFSPALEHSADTSTRSCKYSGAVSSLKRSYKVITMSDDGTVLSMKKPCKGRPGGMTGVVVVDSNLLGAVGCRVSLKDYIARHKRLKNDYTVEDSSYSALWLRIFLRSCSCLTFW